VRTSPGASLGMPPVWTAERVVDALRAWVAREGRLPTAKEWEYAQSDYPTHYTVRRVFGDWNRALMEAAPRLVQERSAAIAERAKTLSRLYHDEGMTVYDIGRAEGKTGSAIAQEMKRLGVERRTGGARSGVRRIKPPPRKLLERQICSERMCVKSLAQHHGVNRKTVDSWLAAYGLPASFADCTSFIDEVVRRHATMSATQVALELEVSKSLVLRIVRIHGLPRSLSEARKRKRPTRPTPPRAELLERYEREELSISELAYVYRADPETVARWLQRHGIDLRGRTASKQTSRFRARSAAARKGPKSHLYRGAQHGSRDLWRDWQWRQARDEAIRIDGGRCADCGETMRSAALRATEGSRVVNVHHLVPRFLRGSDTQRNLVSLHNACHQRREHEFDRLAREAVTRGWLTPAPEWRLTAAGRARYGTRSSLVRSLTQPYPHLHNRRLAALGGRNGGELQAQPPIEIDAELPVERHRFKIKARQPPELRIERTCANPACGAPFRTNRKSQVYCGAKCRDHMYYARLKARRRTVETAALSQAGSDGDPDPRMSSWGKGSLPSHDTTEEVPR
jgi:hypothetical protein